uniref:Uncharacterized protein n=1 Tax=Podoviridae sp. ctZkC8 TaxID=2825259 RepID=A0A8S5UBR6_9CAUD|nr:MAG TPA: hypothetical protein [Podoviridae sp. ctZkC8]
MNLVFLLLLSYTIHHQPYSTYNQFLYYLYRLYISFHYTNILIYNILYPYPFHGLQRVSNQLEQT